MNSQACREIVLIDLVGELDTTMSKMLDREIRALGAAQSATIVVQLERLDSTQWAGLCDLAAVIEGHRRGGLDIRAQSRLRRVRELLDEFRIPCDIPQTQSMMRRRLIIARTPRPQVA